MVGTAAVEGGDDDSCGESLLPQLTNRADAMMTAIRTVIALEFTMLKIQGG
jgi:hypothetical protein